MTDQRPQVAQYAWTEGSMLVNYTSDKGDKLQAALFLPAGYEKGKSYPTIVNIYEKMSQQAQSVRQPDGERLQSLALHEQWLRSAAPGHHLSSVNDPGMSAVWCVVPALKAAIATGVIDAKRSV